MLIGCSSLSNPPSSFTDIYVSASGRLLRWISALQLLKAELVSYHLLTECAAKRLPLQRGVEAFAPRVEPRSTTGLAPGGIQDNLGALGSESDNLILFGPLAAADAGPDRNHTSLPVIGPTAGTR